MKVDSSNDKDGKINSSQIGQGAQFSCIETAIISCIVYTLNGLALTNKRTIFKQIVKTIHRLGIEM